MPKVDPYKNYLFKVELDGVFEGGFTECSGLSSEVQVIEYREGGDSATVRKYIGQTTYGDITLKRGVTDSRKIYDWHLAAINGQYERIDGSVVLLDDLGQERVRWNFYNAWASKYEAPSFDAKGSEIAISTLTISCERIERAA